MTDPVGLLIKDAEVDGAGRSDCRVRDGVVDEVGIGLAPQPGEMVIDGSGGALLPGLADHHLHLAAMAAWAASVDVTDLDVGDAARRVREAVPDARGWRRVVGYDDERHGPLDRTVLDGWSPTSPLRVQHRSGALWVLNTAALERLNATNDPPEGLERDSTGSPTGLLWRADTWLHTRMDGAAALDLSDVGAKLAGLGITHVTDASPSPESAHLAADAVRSGAIPQKVLLLADGFELAQHPRLFLGPVKLIVADHSLPDPDELAAHIREAHGRDRSVAVHCVTRTALAVTLAAFDGAGVRVGDRIEHCAIADRAAATEIALRGLRVVTQPSLVARRGDDYFERSEPTDRGDLWPYATLLAAGALVAPSSDAPYGDPDPWSCLRAARDRRTRSGRILGRGESVSTSVALAGMLSPLTDPGGEPRRIVVGAPADLVLLDRSRADVLDEPYAEAVRATFVAGRAVFGG
jgi:predicted amidohydrolase YtcJ